jgi:hypothetical protein
VTYEEFRAAWDSALRESKLSMIGLHGQEKLDLRSLDRTYKMYVEPLGGQDAEPFFVTATLSFRWDVLNTARTNTKEEDMLMTLYGPDGVPKHRTSKPYVRVDITLNATVSEGKKLPMPSTLAWASWAEEVMGRLEDIEPLTPIEKVRENRAGNLEVLAWHGEPKAEVSVEPDGELRLTAVRISGFQLMETPRVFDIGEKPDRVPHKDLRDMFRRVRASLIAWMQSLDHLKAR